MMLLLRPILTAFGRWGSLSASPEFEATTSKPSLPFGIAPITLNIQELHFSRQPTGGEPSLRRVYSWLPHPLCILRTVDVHGFVCCGLHCFKHFARRVSRQALIENRQVHFFFFGKVNLNQRVRAI